MNNKLIISLAINLLCAGSVLAANKTCGVRTNKSYQVEIVNDSEGLATVQSHSGMQKALRGDRIQDGQKKTILVEESGAHITIMFGPEHQKVTKTIKFYGKSTDSKGSANTMITLMPTNVKTQGFYTQMPKAFNVSLVNRSGGQVKIVNGNNSGLKSGTIIKNNNKPLNAHITPRSSAVVKMGPEESKKLYNVMFENQSGKNPELRFVQQTMFDKGIRPQDVTIHVRPVNNPGSPVYFHSNSKMKDCYKKAVTNKNAATNKQPVKTTKTARAQKAVQ